jgi:UDP-N-acetylglucosamine--N-acetylmuramyl-(pentapeptide) pyrophosphoryl-undecaprenol N-acetylglucosamine transferase
LSLTNNKYRFLFAGGGTGGHLFPAIAVAEKIKSFVPEADILFIGTKNRIESRVVPELGYKFKSIWIKGFSRRFNIHNLLFPLKVIVSLLQSAFINFKYRPTVAIGSGGYVAGPAIWTATLFGAKVILLEQNSYPGVTTRLLEKNAQEIHISFENTKKYLKNKKSVHFTGNPVRSSLSLIDNQKALSLLGLNSQKKTLLIIGGSLGAGSLNNAIASSLETFNESDIQIIWQTGDYYFSKYNSYKSSSVLVSPFIKDMSIAYSAADLLIARAGATTIAEITSIGIASILVPSPNVAANHQYHNAKSLSDLNASILLEDKNLTELPDTVINLINDKNKLAMLRQNALLAGKPDAADTIAKNAIKYAEAL